MSFINCNIACQDIWIDLQLIHQIPIPALVNLLDIVCMTQSQLMYSVDSIAVPLFINPNYSETSKLVSAYAISIYES